jgi:hypothetical protein
VSRALRIDGSPQITHANAGTGFMASGNDMKAANETYGGFTVLVKWGTIISAIAAAIVIWLVA